MKSLFYAIVATCVAMLATSGIVVYATAATAPRELVGEEASLDPSADLDIAIAQQLLEIRARLRAVSAPHQ